jgi:lysozyme family protein
MLQKAAGVRPADGVIGSQTVARVNQLLLSSTGEHMIMESMIEQQALRYAEIVKARPVQLNCLVGWVRRAFERGE